MEWKEYLRKFSRLLVLHNGVGNAMEILEEVDDLHWSAVQGGKTDESFIAEFGTPETAARELAAERPSRRYSERARFGVGIALMCLGVLLCQTRVRYPGKEWVPLFLAVLVPLALWWLLEVKARLVVDLFAEQKKRWYGEWVGVILVVLLLGYIVGTDFWNSLELFPTFNWYGMVVTGFERIIMLLALVGVVRGLWDVYLCRLDGFPACCLWLGIYCTQTLAMWPLRSMTVSLSLEGLSMTQILLWLQIPAAVCLALTTAIYILLRLALKKLRGEVRAQWTHS